MKDKVKELRGILTVCILLLAVTTAFANHSKSSAMSMGILIVCLAYAYYLTYKLDK